MVISNNPEPSQKDFNILLDNTINSLESESSKNQNEYLNLLGKKFEERVFDHIAENAIGTPFENSIELISGQKFPDIIANKYYGVEVKTTKQDHWTTTGNSVLEGTRVKGIERIYMLFGKMVKPLEFKCRLYEECLSDVVVTHSPRYLINMDLEDGNTIFNKLDLPYDVLRNLPNPIKPITDYYKQFLKPGEEVWWIDQEYQNSKGLIIKIWNNIDLEARSQYKIKAMVLFPEIFSNHGNKFSRIAVWLVNFESIICPNIRDVFSAGGKGDIFWKNKHYKNIPRIIIKMFDAIEEIIRMLFETDIDVLEYHWNRNVDDSIKQWIEQVIENTNYMDLKFNLQEYLEESLY